MADWTPDVISNIAKRIVFVIPRSTVKADKIVEVRTLPREEKNMTVVATNTMTFVLSFSASNRGELELFSCFLVEEFLFLYVFSSILVKQIRKI